MTWLSRAILAAHRVALYVAHGRSVEGRDKSKMGDGVVFV